MYDLSLVTDQLRQTLVDALAASTVWGGGPSPFQISVSAQSPEQSSTNADTDLNLFLFHVTEDSYQKNAFWSAAGQAGPDQPVAYQPACYDLFYLVSARSQSSYVNEQQVMGVALKAMHDNAIVRMPTPVPFGGSPSEVTVTMEHPTWDELCRLWQGITAPMRMAAEYRVGVVFLTPEETATEAPPVTSFTVDAGAAAPWDGVLPALVGTSRTVAYRAPSGLQGYTVTPASTAPALVAPTVPPGQTADLRGSGIAPTDVIYLQELDGSGDIVSETDITSTWVVPLAPPYPSTPPGGVDVRLVAPATLGAPPDCPPPGFYQLCVGRPSEPGWRSNPVPLAIAPWVDPTGGPLLNPSGAGIYSCGVNNVPAAQAEVRLGTVLLSQKPSGLISPGQWQLTGTTLKFKAPAGLAPGQYALRVRVSNVEADPSLWAVV